MAVAGVPDSTRMLITGPYREDSPEVSPDGRWLATRAYGRPTYEEAKRELLKIRDELAEINESAVRRLDEGFEETLTLHRLGLFAKIGRSLKTTNILESVNSQAEERCGRLDHWQNSKQKQRWLAAALLDIEPRLRRLMGYRHLPALRGAIMKELKLGGEEERSKRAA